MTPVNPFNFHNFEVKMIEIKVKFRVIRLLHKSPKSIIHYGKLNSIEVSIFSRLLI